MIKFITRILKDRLAQEQRVLDSIKDTHSAPYYYWQGKINGIKECIQSLDKITISQ